MREHDRQLGEALVKILDEIEQNDRKLEATPRALRRPLKPMSIEEFNNYLNKGEDWIEDPVGEALRAGVREIGKIIARLSGFAVMQEVAEWSAEKTKCRGAIEIIDKNWDGIEDKDGCLWVS